MSIYYSVWLSGLYLITGASVAKTRLTGVSLWWLNPVSCACNGASTSVLQALKQESSIKKCQMFKKIINYQIASGSNYIYENQLQILCVLLTSYCLYVLHFAAFIVGSERLWNEAHLSESLKKKSHNGVFLFCSINLWISVHHRTMHNKVCLFFNAVSRNSRKEKRRPMARS